MVDDTWRPVIDGYEVTIIIYCSLSLKVQIIQDPFDAIRSGTFNKVPVVLGTNKNEGTAFIYGGISSSLSSLYYTAALVEYLGESYVESVLLLYPPVSVCLFTIC